MRSGAFVQIPHLTEQGLSKPNGEFKLPYFPALGMSGEPTFREVVESSAPLGHAHWKN